jgi:hypothetical protein
MAWKLLARRLAPSVGAVVTAAVAHFSIGWAVAAVASIWLLTWTMNMVWLEWFTRKPRAVREDVIRLIDLERGGHTKRRPLGKRRDLGELGRTGRPLIPRDMVPPSRAHEILTKARRRSVSS